MSEGPRNLRADTVLTPDPDVAGRFHADIPEGWKVVYVFGGVTMYTALRAMQEALGRPELQPRHRQRDLPRAGAAGPGHDRRRGAPRRPHRVAGRRRPSRRRQPRVARARRVRRRGTTPSSASSTWSSPTSRGPPRSRDPGAARRLQPRPVRAHQLPRANRLAADRRLRAVGSRLQGRSRAHQGVDAAPVRAATPRRFLRPARGRGARRRDRSRGRARDSARSARPFMVLSLEIGIRFVATPVTPWVLQEIEAWHVGDGYATGPARLWDEARQPLRDRDPDRQPPPLPHQ